jgi:hypothetical protein
MANDRFPSDEFDDFDDYDSYDNYKFDDFDDYAGGAGDSDEKPLTSGHHDDAPLVYDEPDEPLDSGGNQARSAGRRETIARVAADQQSGLSRKPGVTAPDSRLAAFSAPKNANNRYGGRRGVPVEPSQRPRRGAVSNRPQTANRPERKNNFAIYYIGLSVLAIGVCVTVLILVLQNISFNIRSPEVLPTPPPDGLSIFAQNDIRSQTALQITDIVPHGDSMDITLLDISNMRTHEFTVNSDSMVSDRQGSLMSFRQLQVGAIVDIWYDARNPGIVTTLSGSQQAHVWERRSLTNVTVDIENDQIRWGNDVWNYNARTLFLYHGQVFPPSQIQSVDSVTLMGYGNTVWLVQIDSASGVLQVNNANLIANGTIIVAGALFSTLDDLGESVTLPEGTHRVEVQGDNIELFITDIVILAGQITRVNVGDISLRTAFLHVAVSPDDALVFINGELHEGTGTPLVEFGEVLVRVEAEGFHTQEESFNIVQPVNSVAFTLEQIIHENTLVIFTVPTNARVYINGAHVGYSTLTHTVATGTHTIITRIPALGLASAPFTLTVTGNEPGDIVQSFILVAETNDPLDGLTPPVVEPIPTETPFQPPATPTPFPTLPPTETAGPGLEPEPEPEPSPTPLPDIEDVTPPWWQTPPAW